MTDNPVLRHLGLVPYEPTWAAMVKFTNERDDLTPDEIWFVEHPPIFTLGLNASLKDVLDRGNIPVLKIDRGGQVTYHAPGQLVVYPLIDLRRRTMGVRDLVVALENAIVTYVAQLGITATGSRTAPGVYVDGAKLASIGLRIRRGASYHGISLNVALDLKPFKRINVCGKQGQAVISLADLCGPIDVPAAAFGLTPHLMQALGYGLAQSAISTDLQALNSR